MIRNKISSFFVLFLLLIVLYFFYSISFRNNFSGIIKPTYAEPPLGDVTGDGMVKMSDVSRLYRSVKHIIKLSESEKIYGDVVYDGEIKMDDVSKLYRYVKKVVPKLSSTEVSSLHYYSQINYSYVPLCGNNETVSNSGCGVASFAMIATSYSDSKFNPEFVANWFCKNYYSYTHGALNHRAITQKTLDYFGLRASVLFDKTDQYNYGNYNFGKTYKASEGELILATVQSGRSIMIGMPGHWSVIGPNSNCKSNQVYFYNVNGYKSYMNGCYTPEALFYDTYNYSNKCDKSGWCGWDYAIAFEAK